MDNSGGASALRYRLLRGPVGLAPLRVLACRTFVWAGGEARAVVLGASHAVVFRHGGQEWVEMLTCAAPKADGEAASLLTAPLPESPNGAWEQSLPEEWMEGRARGTVRLSRFPLFPGDSDALREAFAPGCVLSRDFPRAQGRTPRTRIGWRADGATLSIETVHTYPEQNCAVRSETRLCFFPEGSRR